MKKAVVKNDNIAVSLNTHLLCLLEIQSSINEVLNQGIVFIIAMI
jgi:hypothetical protein